MRCRLIASVMLASVASAADAEPVYIPLGSADAIVVIESAEDRVIGRIDDVPAVHGLAATPDGRYLIAGSADERPTGTGAPERPEAVSEDEHAAHHPEPGVKAGPIASMVSTVSVIDAATRSVSRRIDVPGGVHHVAADPTGRFAAVTHPALGAVTVLDLSTFEIAATIATGPFASYAAFSPDGGRLYVSNPGNQTISEIDVRRWIVSRNAVAGESPEHLVVSADGGRLYVNNVDVGTVSVLDTQTLEIVQTLQAGKPLHGLDLAEDDRTLFVAVLGEDRVLAFDLAGGAPREVKLAPAPYHLAAVTGTGKVYVSSDVEPKLWILDQATLAVKGEIEIGGKGHQMAFAASR